MSLALPTRDVFVGLAALRFELVQKSIGAARPATDSPHVGWWTVERAFFVAWQMDLDIGT